MKNPDSSLPTRMHAAVFSRYGGPEVVSIEEAAVPKPADNEVLLRVIAATVSATDAIMRKGRPFSARLAMGLLRPGEAVLGTEFCAEVVQTGKDVDRFVRGDIVVGASGDSFGTHAQYIKLPEDGVLAQVPRGVNPVDMLAISEGAMTALPFLRDGGQIRRGMQVLVIGASGSVGSAAVQLASHFGAEVTGVCSARNADLVRSLGAEHVVDYTTQDFTDLDARYHIIFDTVGRNSFGHSRRVLRPDGVYMTTILSVPILLQMLFTSRSRGQKAVLMLTGLRPIKQRAKDLRYLCDLAADGGISPVIDSRMPLDEIVQAHRLVDSGHKRGSLILEMPGS